VKIKKYVAPTMPEAMKIIRREFGKDAVILNTKEVRKGGFLGFFTKKNLEVVAAIDSDNAEPKRKQKQPDVKSEKNNVRKQEARDDLAEQLKSLQKQIDTMGHYPKPIANMDDWLFRQEVLPEIRGRWLNGMLKTWYGNDESMQPDELNDALQKWINAELSGVLPAAPRTPPFTKKYLQLVGPTGVGKTTTLAKIAGKAKLEDGKRIAFITTDTYRIAAIDQLKTYANILDVPIEVAYSRDDFKKAKVLFSDYDLVLIDSAGRNFRESSFVTELQEAVPFGDDIETCLVFSLTSKYGDMKEIYRQFKHLHIEKMIFTKVDETVAFGAVVNLMLTEKVNPVFITNGQNVPDDLLEVSPSFLVKMLMGEKTSV
jgi:flagellar biosynthesis protein FlhF